jgi:hypothetical protein
MYTLKESNTKVSDISLICKESRDAFPLYNSMSYTFNYNPF